MWSVMVCLSEGDVQFLFDVTFDLAKWHYLFHISAPYSSALMLACY